MAGDFTDLPVFDAFDAIAVISQAAAPTRSRPRHVIRSAYASPGEGRPTNISRMEVTMTRSAAGGDSQPDQPHSHPAAAARSAVAQHAAYDPHRSRRRVLGTDIVLLTLGITGLASPDPELIRAGYLAMGLLADAVLLPRALAVPITGILLALEHAGGWRSTGG
jgi:hypothetical protein